MVASCSEHHVSAEPYNKKLRLPGSSIAMFCIKDF